MRSVNASWTVAAGAALLVAGCALALGVDFGDVELANDGGVSADGALPSSGPNRDATSDGASSSGDGSVPSEAGITDAGYDAFDAFDAKSCDEDGDGFLSPACGGDDCDDHDARTHPDAGFLNDAPTPPRMGDWDCNGVVERRWNIFTACSGGATGCLDKSGFTVDTPCSASNTFKECGVQNNNCVLFVNFTNTQPCR